MPRSFIPAAVLALAAALMVSVPATLLASTRAPQQQEEVTAARFDVEQVARAETVSRSRLVIATPSPSATPAAETPAPPPAAQTAAPAHAAPAPVAPARPVVPSVADARAFALGQIGGAQFDCLDALFQHESGWNPGAMNPYSGAYGIPQALPGGKMATYGADWAYNPVTQVRWGLGYIAARYGSACGAWSFWLSHQWY